MTHIQIKKMVFAAMMLATALLLPFLTGQIPEIGKMLLPMHFPVLICGFLCGPIWGLLVGLVAAPFRFLIFGMPPMPVCLFMAGELAVYGLISGILYRVFPKKLPFYYINLLISMIAGRIVDGILHFIVAGVQGETYLFNTFITATVLNAWPGIVLQILLIPPVIMALHKIGAKQKEPMKNAEKK